MMVNSPNLTELIGGDRTILSEFSERRGGNGYDH